MTGVFDRVISCGPTALPRDRTGAVAFPMDSEVSVLTEVHNTVVEDLSVDLLFCRKDFLIGLYYSLAKY